MTMKGGWSPRGGSVQGVAVARLAVDRPPMEEHAVQKVSHGLPTHTALKQKAHVEMRKSRVVILYILTEPQSLNAGNQQLELLLSDISLNLLIQFSTKRKSTHLTMSHYFVKGTRSSLPPGLCVVR